MLNETEPDTAPGLGRCLTAARPQQSLVFRECPDLPLRFPAPLKLPRAEVQLSTSPSSPNLSGVPMSPGPAALPSHPLLRGCWLTWGLDPKQHIWGQHCVGATQVSTHTHKHCPGLLLVVPGDVASTPCTSPSPQHNPPGNFLSFQPWQGREFPRNHSTHAKLLRKVEKNPELTAAAGGRDEISLQERSLPEDSLIPGKHHTSHSLRTEGISS